MKRLLLIQLLALPLLAQPVPTANVTGTARVGAIWPHDLTFEWHCESTTAEYSVGDNTGALTGTAVVTNTVAYDGTYSLLSPDGSDYLSFDVTDDDLLNGDEGTVDFYGYVETFVNGASFFYGYANGTNMIYVTMVTGQKVTIWHKGQDTTRWITSTNTFNTNEWFHVKAKWRRGSSPYLQMELNGSPTPYTTSDLIEQNVGMATLRVGEVNAIASRTYLDNVKVYSKWKD
jgi:hypothetical protein